RGARSGATRGNVRQSGIRSNRLWQRDNLHLLRPGDLRTRAVRAAALRAFLPDEDITMTKVHAWRRRRAPACGVRPALSRLSVERLEDRTLLDGNAIVSENLLPGTSPDVWGVGA